MATQPSTVERVRVEPIGHGLYRLRVVTPTVSVVLVLIVPIWVLLIVDRVALLWMPWFVVVTLFTLWQGVDTLRNGVCARPRQ